MTQTPPEIASAHWAEQYDSTHSFTSPEITIAVEQNTNSHIFRFTPRWGPGTTNNMDDLSFELAIALQLEDLAAITASRKGKGKTISENEAAFNDYREHLEKTAQLLRDERLAQSIDEAVRADADELSRITRAELKDENDRELAFKLSEDPSITAVNKDRKWRNMAVGSGIEATDASIKQWEEKCFEWDVLESQVFFFFRLLKVSSIL